MRLLLLVFILFVSSSYPKAQLIPADTTTMLSKTWMVKEVLDPGFADAEDEEDFREFIKTMRLQLKKDGTLILTNGKEKIPGNWTLNRKSKELKLIIDNDPVILQITSLSSSQFKFINKGDSGVPSGTFIVVQ